MAKVDSVHTRQLIIFTILFTGYAFYALNRKAVSLVLPELISSGLDKSDAGKWQTLLDCFTAILILQV